MRDRRVDTIAGPPDSTRPGNPWPRVLGFFLAIALVVAGMGYCVASFASPPPRELRVERIEPGLPFFIPVTVFGADRDGFTYGAWVTYDGQRATAYLARNPETLCRLTWDPGFATDDPVAGAFVDRCGEARYRFDGGVLDGSAPKDLDEFPTRMEGRAIIVNITRLRLGECREPGAAACSPADEPREVRVPRNELPPAFATE